MEIKVDGQACYYEVGRERIYVAVVFESVDNDKWYADSYDGEKDFDYFTDKPFGTKQDAVKHVDETMKDIFRRILDE